MLRRSWPTLLALGLFVTPADANAVEPAALLEQLDANENGEIEAEEIAQPQRQLFARLLRTADADHSGSLTLAELTAGLTPQRPAKPLEKPVSSRLPGADAFEVVMAKLDVDGDGRLTKGEMQTGWQDAFDAMLEAADRDADGKLTAPEIARGGPRLTRVAMRIARQRDLDVDAELAKLRQSKKQRGGQRNGTSRRSRDQSNAALKMTDRVFNHWDKNGDGKLQADEYPSQRAFRKADADKNGIVTRSEFRRVSRDTPNTRDTASRFRELDRDGNGSLSKDEVPEAFRNRFDAADANGDGELTAAEVRRALRD